MDLCIFHGNFFQNCFPEFAHILQVEFLTVCAGFVSRPPSGERFQHRVLCCFRKKTVDEKFAERVFSRLWSSLKAHIFHVFHWNFTRKCHLEFAHILHAKFLTVLWSMVSPRLGPLESGVGRARSTGDLRNCCFGGMGRISEGETFDLTDPTVKSRSLLRNSDSVQIICSRFLSIPLKQRICAFAYLPVKENIVF